jgi:hypothetical protein
MSKQLVQELEASRIWALLAYEGNFNLIDKLHNAEIKEPGYLTIIVPDEGFSPNDEVHNLIIDWLKGRKYINLINIRKEIFELKQARSWVKGKL